METPSQGPLVPVKQDRWEGAERLVRVVWVVVVVGGGEEGGGVGSNGSAILPVTCNVQLYVYMYVCT